MTCRDDVDDVGDRFCTWAGTGWRVDTRPSQWPRQRPTWRRRKWRHARRHMARRLRTKLVNSPTRQLAESEVSFSPASRVALMRSLSEFRLRQRQHYSLRPSSERARWLVGEATFRVGDSATAAAIADGHHFDRSKHRAIVTRCFITETIVVLRPVQMLLMKSSPLFLQSAQTELRAQSVAWLFIRTPRVTACTIKNIRISTYILWRFFNILTEPVPYTFVSVNQTINQSINQKL